MIGRTGLRESKDDWSNWSERVRGLLSRTGLSEEIQRMVKSNSSEIVKG